jgi:hypothetical protein
MLVGIITSRQVFGVPAVLAADHDTVVAIAGPAIQSVLAGVSRADAERSGS